jgi:predicted alpha/beta hydrolase family esterase
MPDKSDSQHWRDRAERARKQAKRVTEPRSNWRLLRLADAYEDLAELIEQRTGRASGH